MTVSGAANFALSFWGLWDGVFFCLLKEPNFSKHIASKKASLFPTGKRDENKHLISRTVL